MSTLTTAGAVSAYLGIAFNEAQTGEATALLGAADAAIQNYTGRTWLGGPITGEVHVPDGPLLFLRQRPITSVESVTAGWYFNATPVPLTAGSEYAVRDLAQGVLLLTPWRTGRPTDRPYETLSVSYTPAATVPADVSLAATLLVASWLQAALAGDGNDVQPGALVRRRVDDVEYQWAAPAPGHSAMSGLPPAVEALLRPYASQLVFA